MVWFFLPVQFQWQPHTTRNLKQVAASNLQNSTGEKNHTMATGHKIIPQASNFYTGFLAILFFFFGIHSFALICNASQPIVLRLFVLQEGHSMHQSLLVWAPNTLNLGDYRASFKEKQPNSFIKNNTSSGMIFSSSSVSVTTTHNHKPQTGGSK